MMSKYLLDRIANFRRARSTTPQMIAALDKELDEQFTKASYSYIDDLDDDDDDDDDEAELKEGQRWPQTLTSTFDSSGQPLIAGDYVVIPTNDDADWTTEDEFIVAKFIRLEWYDETYPDIVLDSLDGEGEWTFEVAPHRHIWRVPPEAVTSRSMFGVNDAGHVVMTPIMEVKPDTIAKHLLLFGGASMYTDTCDPPSGSASP